MNRRGAGVGSIEYGAMLRRRKGSEGVDGEYSQAVQQVSVDGIEYMSHPHL